MGWSSGSELFYNIYDLIKYHLPENESVRKKFIKKLIYLFEDHDCDNISDGMYEYPDIESAYKELHPEEFEDEE